MFEDFDAHNNQKQEEDEDSETLSYSYPSYARFTYTGKTKSRLGRNRFMRQTGSKEETKKPDEDISETSNSKTNRHFLQSNTQAPKTPGVSWLQRDSSVPAHPYTPGGNSKNVHGSCSELNSFPSQSNFLFNLKNDSVQNSTCKRNLPFCTTPFKSKEAPKENQGNNNPLRDLNQILKPENPFSKLNFFGQSHEENKENADKIKIENARNSDVNPSWNQLKKICDDAIPYPTLAASVPEADKGIHTGNQQDFGKTPRSNISAPFSAVERRDDDSTNTPLDLSSTDNSVSRSFISRSLMSGCDQLDSDSSVSSNRLKDATKESIRKADDTTTQRTNTDALNSFLPTFLVPKKKNNQTDSPDDDASAYSIGTVVERIFDFQPQGPFQKQYVHTQDPAKTQKSTGAIRDAGATENDVHSSSQCKSAFHNDTKKTSPPSLPINFTFKGPSPCPLPYTNSEVKSSSQLELYKKSSPPSAPGSIYSLEPPKLSHPSVLSTPDLVKDGQYQKQEQNVYTQQSVNINLKNEKEINLLAQNMDMKLAVVSKSTANDQIASDKNANALKNTNLSLNPTNQIIPSNRCRSDLKLTENVVKPSVSIQQKLPSSNQVQRGSESQNMVGIQHEARPPVVLEPGEGNLNKVSLQQANTAPRDPAMYSRPPENIQSTNLSQKTYLAPQQTLDQNNASNFPHVKPEVPQLVSSKPSFPAMKKPNQFKMSAPRGMPSRADTELSVNGKSYAILSMLGKGGSSEVYQVLDPSSSKLLAVKCVDLSMVDKTIADGYLNEIDLLSRLQGCASVIRMFDYEYVQECKMLYVVMEKGDTDLSHLIRDISKTKKISMSMIIYYWTEMLQAVKDIHDQGIIHSDLKPANFLLVSGRLKLIDFGIASSQGDMTSVVKEVTTGTWNYMSPEAIKNNNASGRGFKITYKSDVWSLGCILYNLVYGKTPFSHITNTWGKLSAIADPNHCIEFPGVGAPAVLVKALRSCFHREPKMRPTVAELLSLPYHSTGDGGDLSSVGQQVQALLPTQWWLKVAHLFPGVKSNQEGKNTDNAG